MRQLPEVSSRYGAPMGRPTTIPTVPTEMVIQQLEWVDGDYDQSGAYWGGPLHKGTEYIWWAYSEDGHEVFVRAKNRADAESKVSNMAPLATLIEDNDCAIEEMLDAYIVCALWSTNGDDEKPLDDEHDASDLTPEWRAAMRADVAKFLQENKADIGSHYSAAGHDLWLNRNGHGCGFWESDRPYGKDAAKRLDKAARKLGEVYLYVGDDGKIYCD